MDFFRETTFRPLGSAAPSIFSHVLEIHQGLLAHTPSGAGVLLPPKNLIATI